MSINGRIVLDRKGAEALVAGATRTRDIAAAICRALAAAVMAKGITVNVVNPGPTDSGWIDDELRDVLLRRFPASRIGMPEDTARLVAWLASAEANWVTGQVIHSEGGFLR